MLAVSGGIDSVSLLHGCLALRRLRGLHLEVAHLDHGIRRQSARDARFVQKLSEKQGVPFHLKALKPPAGGVNLEAWGRGVRYEFFSQLLRRRKLDLVLTAHNANDVAETFLMRLVANKELTSIERFNPRRQVLRPFLSVSREEIRRYAKQEGLKYVEDSTNQDTTRLRNRVRHKLLPLLIKEFDPRMVETISNRARGILEDSAWAYELAARAKAGLGGYKFGSKPWLRSLKGTLAKLPSAVAWRLAEELLMPRLGFKMGRSKAQSLVEFFLGEEVGLELPGGLRLRRYQGGISFRKGVQSKGHRPD